MELHEKQEQFEYRTPGDLYPHPEPFSPEEWNKKLRRIGGVCPFGDARLRIVWGGTETKPGYRQTDRGSEPALVIKYPAPTARYQHLVGYQYITPGAEDKPIFVPRADLVPKGVFVVPVIETVQLGALRWMFERKFTPEELVAMQMYPDPRSPQAKTFGVRGRRRYIAPMNPRGEYVGLYPLQTPEGRYFEPTPEWFDALAENQRITETATEGDKSVLLSKALDAIDENERKAKERERDELEGIVEDVTIAVEKAPQGQVIFH